MEFISTTATAGEKLKRLAKTLRKSSKTSLAVALDGLAGVHALAGDTDGIDGTEDNAGAILTADALLRARALGLDARARLADNDGYGFFAALGDLVVTGPTRTNVNDFRAILIDK